MTSKTMNQLPDAQPLTGPEWVYGTQQGQPVKLSADRVVKTVTDKSVEAASYAADALVSENNSDASEAAALVSKNAAATSESSALARKNSAATSESDTLGFKTTTLDREAAAALSASDAARYKTQSANNSLSSKNQADAADAIYGEMTTVSKTISAQYGNTVNIPTGPNHDLNGVDFAALYRSPNTVVAQCVYETSRDSDPMWPKRMGHTSWMNESLIGTWLPGSFSSEMDARDYFGSLFANSVVTGDSSTFTNSVGNWGSVTNGTIAAVNGRLRLTTTAGGAVPQTSLAINTVVGQRYQVAVRVTSGPATPKNIFIKVGLTAGDSSIVMVNTLSSATIDMRYGSFVATATTTYVTLGSSNVVSAGDIFEFDDFTVKPVDLNINASGAYYQDSSDGKYKRLWANRVGQSSSMTSTGIYQRVNLATITSKVDGIGDKLVEDSTNGYHNVSVVGGGSIMGATFTASVRAKAGERNWIALQIGGNSNAWFDLTAGVVGTMSTSGISASISAVAGQPGYYDCAFTAPANINANFIISICPGNAQAQYQGDGTSGLYISQVDVRTGTLGGYELRTDGYLGVTETFRGNKAEFPKIAGIIAESSRVVVHDLLESGRPMWMVIPVSSTNPVFGNTITSVAAREGRLLIGSNSSTAGALAMIDFARDRIEFWTATAYYHSRYNIANRNAVDASGYTQMATPGIVNRQVNAVALTTLPDAPVDPISRLPVPIIAAATNGGVSVIKHDGSVVSSSLTNPMMSVAIIERTKEMVATWSSGESSYMYGNVGSLTASFTHVKTLNSVTPPNVNAAGGIQKKAVDIGAGMFASLNSLAEKGITLLRQNRSTLLGGLAAYITPNFGTGWMAGEVRRAWMADVSPGTLSASQELVTDGTFDDPANVALWAIQDTNVTRAYVGNALQVTTNASAGSDSVYQQMTTIPGVQYTVTAQCTPGLNATGGYMQVRDGTISGPAITATGNTSPSSGSLTPTITFTATGTAPWLRIGTVKTANDSVNTWDNVSCKPTGIADRSYKGKNLGLFGTLAKTAVASAAQLVAYSGFSATNYLQEAYSADFDFGTGAQYWPVWGSLPAMLPAANHPRGSELVTNGGFADATGWNTDAGWVIQNGRAEFTQTGSGNRNVYGTGLNSFVQAGKTYEVSFDVVSGSGFRPFLAGVAAGPISDGAGTTYKAVFTATASGNVLVNGGLATSGAIDNLSVKELLPAYAFDRSAVTGPYIRGGTTYSGRLVAEMYDGTTTRTVTTDAAYNTGQFFSWGVAYTTDGTLAIVVNGCTVKSTTGTPLLTMNNTNALLTVGNARTLDAPWPGSICLFKPSATVPSTEAISWIYEQEKQMFRDGAQVILPDTGALVDMDYDPMTDKLYVCSAANESSFIGLVRTSSTPVLAGSIAKVAAQESYKLIARTTTNPGVDLTTPTYKMRAEVGKTPRGNIIKQNFEFDSTTGQTDFVLPVGWTALKVSVAGANKREGSTKDWTRVYDGFKETIRFATSPGNGTWVSIQAIKTF